MRSWKFIALVAAGFVSAGVAIGAVVAAHQSTRPAVLPSGPPAGSYRGSKPPPGIRAPDFRLRSYRGGEVQMRDLKGKVVVVTFLDTACRDKCPIIASLMGAGMHRLTPGERAQVEALAISVLPQVDTPVRVRRFLQQRHALGALDWLIGPVPDLLKVWKAFSVLAASDTGNANVHSATVRIFDRSGVWVSTLHVGEDLTPANFAHDVRVALHARP